MTNLFVVGFRKDKHSVQTVYFVRKIAVFTKIVIPLHSLLKKGGQNNIADVAQLARARDL